MASSEEDLVDAVLAYARKKDRPELAAWLDEHLEESGQP